MSTPLLIESIKLKDGKFYNLGLHSERMNKSCKVLKIPNSGYNLQDFMTHISYPKQGLWKCRVLYDERIKRIHFVSYTPKPIASLRVVTDNNIDYRVKQVARNNLDLLYAKRGACDDIIIIKNDFITDSYYGNLLFYKDGNWFTPKTYLLEGTQRAALLQKEKIREMNVHLANLKDFEKVKIINAMLDLRDGPEIPISQVYF